MVTKQNGSALVHNANEMAPRSQLIRHRHGLGLVLAIVSGTILFSSLQMLSVTNDMAGAGVAIHIPPATQVNEPVEYFPAAYQSQAQNAQAEEHIQAF